MWWLLGGRYTYPAALKTKMYLWSSLNNHAFLLTFYELRGCHKIKDVQKPQQLRNDENKITNCQILNRYNNTDIFLLHAIKLFWKGHRGTSFDSANSGRSCIWNEEKKPCASHSKFFCVHEEKWCGFTQNGKSKFHCSLLTVALETCLHTVAQL